MKKSILFKLLLVSIVALQGCSATGPKFTNVANVDTGESLIYIYRNSAFLKALTYPFVYVDGKEIGPLRNGGYLKSVVEPGEHEVVIKGQIFPGDWVQDPIKLNVVTSSTEPTFIKLWLGDAELIPGSYITLASSNAAVVEPEFGLKEIKQCRYSK